MYSFRQEIDPWEKYYLLKKIESAEEIEECVQYMIDRAIKLNRLDDHAREELARLSAQPNALLSQRSHEPSDAQI